jgi:hypothetical protein
MQRPKSWTQHAHAAAARATAENELLSSAIKVIIPSVVNRPRSAVGETPDKGVIHFFTTTSLF